MSDTTDNKIIIREVVSLLSKKLSTIFHERNILRAVDSRKYHGVSEELDMCLFVCTNELQKPKVRAGQRASIFEKCYWLTLSEKKRKVIVFTNEDFYNKFIEGYSEFLKGIETMLIKYE
ncbi:MAG: hypothetical protein K0R80_2155 [Clostridia bacterium]|jgi:hypothetical protein|nr:hypothetical protein [Clostridia bacterium]